MHTKHIVSLSLAIALLAGLHAGAAQAGDLADISIRKDGAEHALSVDLEQLGDGQTLQLSTEAGLPAIVSRDGDSLDIDIAGEQFEVKVGHHVEALWVDAAAAGGEIEVIRLGEGELTSTDLDKQVKVIRLQGEQESAVIDGEKKVFVMRRSADGPMDEAEIEALVEEAKAESGIAQGDGTEITVRRRITRD